MKKIFFGLVLLILSGCSSKEELYKNYRIENSSYKTALAVPLDSVKYLYNSYPSRSSSTQNEANEYALTKCETDTKEKCILLYEDNVYVGNKYLGRSNVRFDDHYYYCSNLKLDLISVAKCSIERRSNTLKFWGEKGSAYGNYFDSLLINTADKFTKKQISENEAKLFLSEKILEIQKQIQASTPVVVYQDAPGVDWNKLNEIWRGQGSTGGGIPAPTTRCTSRVVGNTVRTDCY